VEDKGSLVTSRGVQSYLFSAKKGEEKTPVVKKHIQGKEDNMTSEEELTVKWLLINVF
jgi:hypothetical protein